MTEYYVKVKSICDNCVHQCGVQLGTHETPRWYCSKMGHRKDLPKERSCPDFEFDMNIVRPSVNSHAVIFETYEPLPDEEE